MYDVKLDEKYRLRVIDGKVELLRYDEEWVVNPEGAKAWISAAALIESTVNAAAVHTEDEYPELTDRIDEKLTEAWGPFTRDTEIGIISKNLSRHLDAICANSGVSPQELIEALFG